MHTKVRIILAALACSALAACSGEDVTTNATGLAQQSTVPDTSVPATPVITTPPATSTTTTPVTTPVTTAVTTPAKTPTTPAPAPVTNPVTTVVTTVNNTVTSVLKPILAAASTNVFTTLRVRAAGSDPSQQATPQDIGAFRVPCAYSHMAFDDPIVFPGQPGASHLHMFFGNASTDGNSTTDTLKAANRSTCAGGIANLTAYWVPAMIDTTTNRALVPFDNLIYYKSGYNSIPLSSLRNPPRGLRMITGNKATETTSVADARYNFVCIGPDGVIGTFTKGIPVCPVGGEIEIMLDYPNCWDGVNLDSPDHRSHVAFSGGGSCPSSHPVALPQVSLNIHYRVEVGQNTAKWKLASDNYTTGPGGYSMHGDLWFNWDDGIAESFMTGCVRASKDCHGYLLGDGRTLY